ncbi:diaminopimelate epimerase [Actinomyces ruminicola]|uniref:Diaminopimelate epimerase n=1 Tax=Actinomyces ruminicola TaxID=332524 RepID=A0A1G9TY40_9ACTO|nr:diaminopimelate epimerase [Actinomyces ruminicola]SDM52521.1 diaminopimelate epimerase [Actinomyces ruminicola]
MTIAPGLSGRALIKGYATGNDLLLLVDPECEVAVSAPDVAAVCDRHTGLGADGLVRVVRTAALPGTEAFRAAVPEAEWFLDYYSADGTPAAGTAAAYGDACRLLAAVLDAEGLMPLADGDSVTVGTRGGARTITRLGPLWAVDTGPARLAAVNDPAADPAAEGWDTAVRIPGLEGERAALSLDLSGRHAVVALSEEAELDAVDQCAVDAGEAVAYTPAPSVVPTLELVVPLGEDVDPDTGRRVGLARVRVLVAGTGTPHNSAEGCGAAAVALREWTGDGAPADYLLTLTTGQVGVHVGAEPLVEETALVLTGPVELVGRTTLA